MPPSGLAILIGAGPATETGIARVLSSPTQGNFAVALLSRRPENLQAVISKAHDSFKGLKLKLAIYSIKHSSKKSFLEETRVDFEKSLETYVGGAFTFAQESLKRFFEDHGEQGLVDGAGKKGTLIFTGTLGALRCSAQFAAYGASRASVRQLAQTLAREMSEKGVYVAHTIANGAIVDQDGEDQKLGKKMSADAVGETYLWLHQQKPCLWTHELDMRPACEKF
ncbi:Short-chain alcohol dehydrogenase [Pyrenophora tritici-repentis]|uniref:Oxidoreductase domain containing protein n=1 Tax=Pyrenophora tritici-repentis (strain Pt-1C-BFP) TaxID=426418 RepID=B2W7B1_PYRTR|nr:oxidoreductase domain containing protein [Pyrenophora tritici-repentis Pt-1C-BFP]KAA8618771.1 Short-chain alcohol dehydrogenase of unknown specificity [Pyrenophora tritici-repentis]EDU48619.1 oxidoreductase domain containing protein [Pyrenophora tritici-repentis Pt-1C-BFP]KAG9383817.1 Short-chain alcohol dehydrogenase [Pyrenophora tritici-repentis]KAI1548400.1 hypothetical protein PtrSN001C_002100 [Pyrenophora tritici-repentis]KAI1575917.1 FabG Dehydrogenase with different specificities rel